MIGLNFIFQKIKFKKFCITVKGLRLEYENSNYR